MLYYEYFDYSLQLAEIIWQNHSPIIFILRYGKEEFLTLFTTEYKLASKNIKHFNCSNKLYNILIHISASDIMSDVDQVIINDEYIQAVFRFIAKQFFKNIYKI